MTAKRAAEVVGAAKVRVAEIAAVRQQHRAVDAAAMPSVPVEAIRQQRGQRRQEHRVPHRRSARQEVHQHRDHAAPAILADQHAEPATNNRFQAS